MNVQINRGSPTDVYLELGGGGNPMVHPRCLGGPDVNVDVRSAATPAGGQAVDFTASFEEPLPIGSNEFDAVVSRFVFEHVSRHKVQQLCNEAFRVTKPGGKLFLIVPNTREQCRHLVETDDDEDMGSMLFGDQDYPENLHRNAWTPRLANQRLREAGYENVVFQPYGEKKTDMIVEAVKPTNAAEPAMAEPVAGCSPTLISSGMLLDGTAVVQNTSAATYEPAAGCSLAAFPPYTGPNTAAITSAERAALFGRDYFDGGTKHGGYQGGYHDWPFHEITARHVLARRPESVLELGCGRGYVLKRLQDAGVNAFGVDISQHCQLSRVTDVIQWDVLIPWHGNGVVDLLFSQDLLEHIPEECLPAVFAEMKRSSKRGLHGISFNARVEDDETRCTLRDRSWWAAKFREHGLRHHEIFSKEELEQGALPEDYVRGDGKVKLNIGAYTTQFHHGWLNVDIEDLGKFAEVNRYNFMRHDVRAGFPMFATGTVDAIFSCHFVEHLTYAEARSFLRECRRLLKPGGAMRLIVPNARHLANDMSCDGLSHYDDLNAGCDGAETELMKLWEMTAQGHKSFWDERTLSDFLEAAGFACEVSRFREGKEGFGFAQMQRECLDMLPDYSLFMNAVPKTA
jgi:predicted SAM-dependent methyltransferase